MFGVQAANHGWHTITFAKGEKEMRKKVHRKDEQDCRCHAGENSAARKTDPEGAAMKTTTRQLHGSASRYCRCVAKGASRTAGKSELKCR